jgi:hypothetical protein
MLISILSDIHDNLANLEKCLTWSKNNKIEKVIFCGDTTTIETAAYLAANFSGEIFVVRGNIEIYDETELAGYKNINYCGEIGLAEIGGLNIGFCHEPEKITKILALAPAAPDFIFYGHTHKPWLEKRGTTNVVNPGNVASVWHQATFATLDTANKKLELKIIADIN